ncbi:OpgC domain-containing protein [Vibrio profundi]|uniref:OpgC domain-containing protein n=1 Tax=Vibrio profundi TaxID=1774960 RepID=UPI0037363436
MQRNQSIDTIRGALLLIMTINHFIWITVGWANIQYFTLQPFGQVGAAEGFIFISGLMVGLIYTGSDTALNRTKLFSRSKQLYCYHMGAILMVLVICSLYIAFVPATQDFYGGLFPWLLSDKLMALITSIPMLHKPAYFDILPMYVAFLAMAPLVIHQLKKARVVWVIVLSLLIWQSSRYIDLASMLNPFFSEGTLNTGYFSWLAWQLLFVAGLCLGFTARHKPINWFKYRAATIFVVIAVLIIFILNRNVFAQYGIHQGTLYQIADKPLLGWLRVFNLLLLVYLFAFVIKHWPRLLTFKPLALLGRHSLHVFAWHYVVIFSIAPLVLGFFNFQLSIAVGIIITTLLLYIPPLYREKNQATKLTSKTSHS